MMQVHEPLPIGQEADRLDYARQIIQAEANAIVQVAKGLGGSFLQAVDLIFESPGRVILTGMGKSADVAHKIAGTLNSTGTRAHVLDAPRAVHGDLGMIGPDDLVLIFSHSGETEELVRLLSPMRSLAAAILAITSNGRSTLAREADVAIVLGPIEEVCPLGMAPSTSTTAMMALGDALAFVLMRMREFSHEDFARLHPAGSLGRKLLKVDAIMRRGADLRLASQADTVRGVFAQARRRGRRTGAVMLLNEDGRLAGLFTDSDLARLIEQRREEVLDRPIAEVMTAQPITIDQGSRVTEAVELLRRHRISELPVVDSRGTPVGLLDVTDVIGLLPEEEAEALSQVA